MLPKRCIDGSHNHIAGLHSRPLFGPAGSGIVRNAMSSYLVAEDDVQQETGWHAVCTAAVLFLSVQEALEPGT